MMRDSAGSSTSPVGSSGFTASASRAISLPVTVSRCRELRSALPRECSERVVVREAHDPYYDGDQGDDDDCDDEASYNFV